MDKLLSKEEFFQIYEKAVAWDKSVMGRTAGGIGSLFSFMRGKIKGAINKAKIRSLVSNWGAEYLKALRAVDQNLPAETSIEGETEVNSDNENVISIEEIDNFINLIPIKIKSIEELIQAFNAVSNWGALNNLAGYKTLKKSAVNSKNELYDQPFVDSLNQFITTDENKTKYNEISNQINTLLSAIIGDDPKSYDNQVNLKDFEKVKKLAEIDPSKADIDKLKSYFKANVDKLNIIKEIFSEAQSNATTLKNKKTNESLIIEAVKDMKLPSYVEDIFGSLDPKELDALKNVKNIKSNAAKKMNYQMLSIIAYEAQHLINQVKEKDPAQSTEMQREWDLGIKSLNNYFQDLIDVNKVMASAKADAPGADIKAKIDKASQEADVLENYHIDEQLPNAGGQFKNDQFYLFKVKFFDYKQSSTIKDDHYIGISPLANFVEEVGNTKYYWYRIFGSYSYQKDSKTIDRINPFENTFPYNQKLVKNFEGAENMYYFVIVDRQSVSKNMTEAFIYSNKGSVIWNNKVYVKVDDAAKNEITKNIDKPKESYRVGNLTRFKIQARYLVDKTQLKAFPGVDLADLKNEQGYDNAKFNHDELIKLNLTTGGE